MAVIERGISCLQVPMMFDSYEELDAVRERLAPDGNTDAGPGGLAQLYAAGDSAWFRQPGKNAQATPVAPSPAPVCVTQAAEMARREPSKEQAEGRTFPAQWLFNIESGAALAH